MLKAILRTVMWRLFGRAVGGRTARNVRQVRRLSRMARRMRR